MNDLEVQNSSTPQQQYALIEAKKSEAVSQIQAALVIAKRFPRDEILSEQKIMTACKRYSLAEQGSYAYPRGGQKIEGPSIRLAETMARHWGNIKYGYVELENLEGKSVIECYCHDLESNTLVSRTFTIFHKMALKGGSEKVLKDPRDIYEHVASFAQRRVRAVVLEVIPGDIVEKAVEMCKKTLEIGEKAEPMIDRITRIVRALADIGISKETIETRLGHDVKEVTPPQFVELQQIYNSLKDGLSKREDWFEKKSEQSATVAGREIREKMKGKVSAVIEPVKEADSDPNSFGNFTS